MRTGESLVERMSPHHLENKRLHVREILQKISQQNVSSKQEKHFERRMHCSRRYRSVIPLLLSSGVATTSSASSFLVSAFQGSRSSSSCSRSCRGSNWWAPYHHHHHHHHHHHSFATIREMSTAGESGSPSEEMQLPPISSRVKDTLDPCVVLMKEMIGKYAPLWEDKGGIFSLAQGVVYWDPPPSAQAALESCLWLGASEKSSSSSSSYSAENPMHMYGPDEGLMTLRKAVQEKLSSENGFPQDTNVMVTVGANQAYMNCVLTLMESNTKAIVFAPYYFNHVMAIQMTQPSKDALVVGPSNDEGIPDLDWLEQTLEEHQATTSNSNNNNNNKIRMVTITNPGNPTGVKLSREVLQRAVDLCRTYQCWLVLDCTYEYFSADPIASDENDPFGGCFANDPHVIHIFSFSKSYALAGYRCGYVALSPKATSVFEQMVKVQDTIPIAPSRISQVAALGASDAGRVWVRSQVATLATGRTAILNALSPLPQVMGGSGAMYVMGKLPLSSSSSSTPMNDQDLAEQLVKDYGVAVIPGSFCGFPGWIRVCYANLPPEKCMEAAERLGRGLLELCQNYK